MGTTESSPFHSTIKSPLSCNDDKDNKPEKHQQMLATPSQQNFLNERQVSVLMKMNMEAMKLSAVSEKQLLNRISKDKLQKIALYIRYHSDIVIHLFLDKLIEDFLRDEDGRYKNLFETGKGNGSNCQITRARWEDRLFFDGYKNAEAYERVKYGCLNVGNDSSGVASAYQYGDSYFILNNDTVRSRATLSDGDTANPKRAIGTFSACYHVIQRFTDDELKSIYRQIDPADNIISMIDDCPKIGLVDEEDDVDGEIFTMKEVQIHGHLRFKEDINILVISKRHTPEIASSGSSNSSESDSGGGSGSSLSCNQLLVDKARKFCELYDIELKLQE